MIPPDLAVALACVQIAQHGLFALIAWVSIGVYGSFYVLRSIATPPRHRLRENRLERLGRPVEEPRVAHVTLDRIDFDAESPPLTLEAIEVPSSPRELPLLALVVCGMFGVLSVLGLIAVAGIGSHSYRVRRLVAAWLLRAGPHWTE